MNGSWPLVSMPAANVAWQAAELSAVFLVLSAGFLTISFVLLFPAWRLRYECGRRVGTASEGEGGWIEKLSNSRAMAFARRLRAHSWVVTEVTDGLAFLLITTAAILSIVVAAN